MPGASYLEVDTTPKRPNFLDTVIADQEARKPAAMDAQPWLARYLFVPFRDRALTILQQGLLGLPELRAGYILPITKFKQRIIDYDELKRVPTNYDGTYQPSSEGVSTSKLTDRAPRVVLDAIFRIFNPHHGTNPQEDNGICEIDALRGSEDMVLLHDLQLFALPGEYKTARAQMKQLQSAQEEAPSQLYAQVIQRMIEATEQSAAWARWHYQRLRAQMKNQARSGKEELSPLDRAVCEWLELPEPELRGLLADETQQVAMQGATAPAIPQTQCLNCGTYVNLINGNAPRACYVCANPFYEAEAASDDDPKTETPVERRARNKAVMDHGITGTAHIANKTAERVEPVYAEAKKAKEKSFNNIFKMYVAV